MPTTYTKDQFFDDYMTGLNTGVAFNGTSSLGASHSYKPSPAPAYVPPRVSPMPSGMPLPLRGGGAPVPERPHVPLTLWTALRGLRLHEYLPGQCESAYRRMGRSWLWRPLVLVLACFGAAVAVAALPDLNWYVTAPAGALAGYLALPVLAGAAMLTACLVGFVFQWTVVLGTVGIAGYIVVLVAGALLG